MSIAEKLVTIAENEQKVYNAGYDSGYLEASYQFDSMWSEGYEHGKEEGIQAEYDRFWDDFQQNGNRTSYLHGFAGRCWTNETFKPKYPLKIGNATAMFFYSSIPNIDCELDFTNKSISLANMFAYSWVKSISRFKSYETLTFASTTFEGCTYLTNISFVDDSVIGTSINFKSCPLTAESIDNIIDVLKDLTGKTSQTLTLHADVGNNLTAEQKASITAKNWSLVY